MCICNFILYYSISAPVIYAISIYYLYCAQKLMMREQRMQKYKYYLYCAQILMIRAQENILFILRANIDDARTENAIHLIAIKPYYSHNIILLHFYSFYGTEKFP